MALEIVKGKTLELERVLSHRKKMTQNSINIELENMKQFLSSNGINIAGPFMSTTFSVENEGSEQVMDMEFLIPVDKEVINSGVYVFKPIFRIQNAVYVTHKGDPSKLADTYNQILFFIQENKMTQITTAYNVAINELKPGMGLDDFELDVYIGVTENIL